MHRLMMKPLDGSPEATIAAKLKDCRNGHMMLVDGFSKLWNYEDTTFESSVFDVSGYKWKVIVNPSGEKEDDFLFGEKEDDLSIYLKIKDKSSFGNSLWKVRCDIKLSLISQNGWEDYVFESSVKYKQSKTSHGHENFISRKRLMESRNKYLVNDKAIFYAEISNINSKNTGNRVMIPRSIGTAERFKLIDVPKNKSKFTWKITRFSSFNAQSHSSFDFTVGPRKWRLLMYPKGDDVSSLSVYLTALEYVTNGPKANTLAVYKLRLLDQRRRNHFETEILSALFASPGHVRASWGKTELLPLDKLNDPDNGYLVKDELYIGVEFLLVSATEYL